MFIAYFRIYGKHQQEFFTITLFDFGECLFDFIIRINNGKFLIKKQKQNPFIRSVKIAFRGPLFSLETFLLFSKIVILCEQ